MELENKKLKEDVWPNVWEFIYELSGSGLESSCSQLKKILNWNPISIYNFDNVSESGDKFHASTGLTVESFNNLLEFLNPDKDSCNINFYHTSSRLTQSYDETGSPKSGPELKLWSQDELFMNMTWLNNGFARSHLAWLFKISNATVTRCLVTWTNFCYFFLGAIPIWS